MNKQTPKNFVLQLGSLASLYLTLSFLLVLLFGLINLLLPNDADYYYLSTSYSGAVRMGIAMLLVFFPTYLVLTRMVNKIRRRENQGTYLELTKWLIYLSLLVGGGVLLVDIVVVITTFLEGDLSTRFILKILAVLIVVGVAFFYYLKDAQGYWLKNEAHSKLYALLATVVVGAAIIFGFFNIESPSTVREAKLDEKQVQDLQSIQWQIQDYYYTNEKLPESLSDLMDSPVAPEERVAYEYNLTDTGFSLCAEFTTKTTGVEEMGYARPVMEKGELIQNAYNWNHPAETYCFDRRITATSPTLPIQ